MSTAEERLRMAKSIIDFEARRDAKGRLQVYKLPAGDGGGTYEVAGINDRYHPVEAAHLAQLVKAGPILSRAGQRSLRSNPICATPALIAGHVAPPVFFSVPSVSATAAP